MSVPPDDATIELIKWSISLAVPALSGFVGVIVGALLTGRRDRKRHRLEFVEKQLHNFYSPMLGIRNEIRMRSELRVRIQGAANIEWAKLSERAANNVKALQNLESTRSPEFVRLIEYDNRQLEKELLPAYRQMAALFRDNYYLADEDTRVHYGQLIEFVELWNRRLEDSIPAEVSSNLGHSEAKLAEFYRHLQNKHEALRSKLDEGKP